MGTIDKTAIAYQLKNVYGDRLTDLFNRQAMTYNLFMKSNKNIGVAPGGAGYYFGVRQGAIESVGVRAMGTKLPEPMTGDGVQGRILPKAAYGVLRLDGLTIEAGKGNTRAFVDAQGDAVMDTYKALVSDLNRMCHSDGYGLLGTTSAVATPSTGGTWEVTCNNDRGVRYLRKGQIVDFFVSNAIVTTAAAAKISSINPTTKVLTMETMATTYQGYHPNGGSYSAAASTIASGAEIVRYGARADSHAITQVHREVMGVLGMYDDGTLMTTFENINTTNDPEFKANVMGNSDVNRELSIDLMLAAMDMTAARSDGVQPDIIRMGLGQRRKYFGLMANDVRYQPQTFMGGYEKLGFSQNGAVSIVVDTFTQPNRLFFEPSGAIKKYELKKIGWGGFDPNKMHWRQDYDEATMYLSVYTNLGVEQRNALTVVEDLTEPATMPF